MQEQIVHGSGPSHSKSSYVVLASHNDISKNNKRFRNTLQPQHGLDFEDVATTGYIIKVKIDLTQGRKQWTHKLKMQAASSLSHLRARTGDPHVWAIGAPPREISFIVNVHYTHTLFL